MTTAGARLRFIGRRLWHARTAQRAVSALFVANLLLALLDWFLAGPGWRVVDWEARRRLTRALGPADAYEVTIQATWVDLLAGHVPDQVIHARRLHMKDGLLVEALDVRIRGLTMWNGTITRLDEATFHAVVTQDALNDYLPIRPQHMRYEPSLRLILEPDHVEVRGHQSVLGVPVPLKATGTLRVSGETNLRFVFDQASVALIRLPAMFRELSVLDLETSPFGVRVSAFVVALARVEVTGRASPPLPLVLKSLEASPSPSAVPSPVKEFDLVR